MYHGSGLYRVIFNPFFIALRSFSSREGVLGEDPSDDPAGPTFGCGS